MALTSLKCCNSKLRDTQRAIKEIICLNNNPVYLFKEVDNKISFNCRLIRWIYRKKGQIRTNFYLLSKQLSTKQLRFHPANVTVYFPNKAFTVQKFSVNRQKGNCVRISLQHVVPELRHRPNCISRVHIGLGYRIYLEIVWHEDLFVRFFFPRDNHELEDDPSYTCS